MENKSNLLKKLLIGGAIGLAGVYGYQGETKEITEKYQGNFTAEHANHIVFDEETKANRYEPATLVIKSNIDTLDMGKKYTVNFTEPRFSYIFPTRLNSIK